MQNILHNWKTSSAGILMIVSGITMWLNDHAMVSESVTAILGGIGLLLAADSNNTPPAAA